MKVNRLRVLLVCEEIAKGTTRRVVEEEVVAKEGFEVQPGCPVEVSGELRVPAGAMHSFEAMNNQVRWKLLVQGDIAGWPDFYREFPIVVRPQTEVEK